jgi:hypothetical protein
MSMQQISLKIHNQEVMIKLLWMLKHFETQEVELEYSFTKEKPTNKQYTDEYVKKHWREFIMSTGNDENYYKSEQYKFDYGNYLAEKYS